MTDLEQVLSLVNAARAALGSPPLGELPPGRQRSNGDCVLAKSVGVSFGNRTAWVASGRRSQRKTVARLIASAWDSKQDVLDKRVVRLPDTLREFVAEFDAGEFPELVDSRAGV